MVGKTVAKESDLCLPEEEALDIVALTDGLIATMTSQLKRLKADGLDVGDIEKQIKETKKRFRVARKLLKG